MSLPAELEAAIERAHAEMLQHPQHALLPFFRRCIYNALGSLADPGVRRTRILLDLLTARSVLPIWQKERPNDPWPTHLLAVAEGVLRGEVTQEDAGVAGDAAWNQLETLEADDVQAGPEEANHSILGVVETAIEALLEASGRRSFDSIPVAVQDTDADIDPWSYDTVQCAVTTYAGGVWDPTSDPMKRKEFWEWWLLKAIPEAWEKALQTDPSVK